MSKFNFSKLQTDSQKLSLFGSTVAVKTKFDDLLEGTLYYIDNESIIISNFNSPPHPITKIENDEYYNFINIQQIQDIELISIQNDSEKTLNELLNLQPPLQLVISVNTDQLITTQQKRVQTRQQVLFEHLSMMYKDTLIEDKTIYIPSLRIRIIDPYDSDSCTTDQQNKKGLERVKKMVAKLWENKCVE